ncbi:MAG: beta-lactamase domain protein [Clostridia bacterium]|jgi:L-ascorbate metabolism protein UlaG (beta-lactamase superfamily)|nr:beta-lactamase domain protein [Clostridia bacterium]
MDLNKSTIEKLQSMNLEKDQWMINWIGQGGFVFKTSKGKVICIDPYLSNSVEKFEGIGTRRMWFPSFPLAVFRPDVVICTHDHLDHTDPETLPLIAAYSKALFLAPTTSYEHMKAMNIDEARLKVFNREDIYQGEDFKLRAVYAQHTSDSIGILLETHDLKIYITGDTEESERLYALKDEKIDILITCINGKLGNMNAQEACKLAQHLEVKHVIPMHYGLIPSNTVDLDEFNRICSEKGLNQWLLVPEINYICKMATIRQGVQGLTIERIY